MRILMLTNPYQTGPDVKQLQEDLNLYYPHPSFQNLFKQYLMKAGLYPKAFHPLNTDGQFGPATRAAVLAFQDDKKLKKIDGKAGDETFTALYPYAVARLNVTVIKVPGKGPTQVIVPPKLAPSHPTTSHVLPGLKHPLPAPVAPPPSPVPGTKTEKAHFQVKALGTYNHQFGKPDYLSLNADIMWLLLSPSPNLTMGPDLGVATPLTDGGTNSAYVWWALTWWPAMFKHGRFDLLGISAKAGVGVKESTKGVLQPSANGQLAITAKWDVWKSSGGGSVLSLYGQGFGTGGLTLQGSNVTVSGGMGAAGGLKLTF